MTKRIYTLLVLLFCATFVFAQNSSDVPSYDGTTGFQDEEKTEMSDTYFPPKPKHGTEIGLSLGHHFIHGDVYARPGWGVGLHLRRAINYTVSWRLQAIYGQNYGLEDRRARMGYPNIQLPTATWQGMGYNANSLYYRNYKTTTGWASAQVVFNLSNILFHKKSNKWNLYVFGGVGLLYYKGRTNLLNGNAAYTDENGNPGMAIDPNNYDNDKKEWFTFKRINWIKKNVLDDSYETEFLYDNGDSEDNRIPGWQSHNWLGRTKYNIMPSFDVGAGLSRKINKNFNIAIEHQALISINDNLDGHVTARNMDNVHYTNLKLNFNINPKEGVEPLYWVNPLVSPMEDIARLKREQVVLKDSDGDGVLDEFDEEPDTPEGCPVDTRGRLLDSDGDGIPDCEDKEPFTPYHLVSKVDDKGVAPAKEECESCLTEADIIRIGKTQDWGKKTTVVNQTAAQTGCGEWFLPMIHFDLDKYNLKPEAKASLHQIAQVMKQCPSACVVAIGHTDRLNNNDYNMKLSYNRAKAAVDYLVQVYGISPSRLKVNYGGEETPLIDTKGSSYINRRVEFKVCGSEIDMGAPSGSAGSGFNTSGNAPVKY